jgi:hypothetical protein
MSMYTWVELLKLWEQERLTIEQVVGQLLQQGQASQRAQTALQRQLETLERRLALLEAPPKHPA